MCELALYYYLTPPASSIVLCIGIKNCARVMARAREQKTPKFLGHGCSLYLQQ